MVKYLLALAFSLWDGGSGKGGPEAFHCSGMFWEELEP